MKRPGHRLTQREEHVRYRGERVSTKARTETPEESNPADTLTSDFQPPGL